MPIRLRMMPGVAPVGAAAATCIGDASATGSAEQTGQKHTARIKQRMCLGTKDNDLGL